MDIEQPLNFHTQQIEPEGRTETETVIPLNRFKGDTIFGMDGGDAAKRFATATRSQLHHVDQNNVRQDYRPVTKYDADGNKLTEEE